MSCMCPIGRPVKVTLASEDVIHSFFIPAFRLKHDVVPGRYDTMWFTATKPGRYHLFCAEYCGTEHSGMIGWVTVMTAPDYENWLANGGAEGTMVQQGERLFGQYGCVTCHQLDQQGRCSHPARRVWLARSVERRTNRAGRRRLSFANPS